MSADGSRVILDVGAGQAVRCDWYNLPFDLRGETPTPTKAPAARPTAVPFITTLPSTGTGDGNGAGGWGVLSLAATLTLVGVGTAGFALRRRAARAG